MNKKKLAVLVMLTMPFHSAVAHDNDAASAPFPEKIWVTMKQSGTLTVFPDGVTWPGGPNMLYDAVTPDGRMVMATSPSSNKLYVFDGSSGKILKVIPVGKAPKGVKVTPDGREAWVSNQGSNEISVIDLRSLQVVATIPTEAGPHNVRFTRDGRIAYATLQGGAGLGVIDVSQRKMLRVIPTPGLTGPHNLDLTPDEKTAFVRDFVHNVGVVDLTSGQVKKVIRVGNAHGGIDVTPDGRFAAAAAIAENYISVIDTQTLQVTNIEVGQGPHGIRASRDSRWLYVSLTQENALAVVDLRTLKVTAKIPTEKFPFWVAVQGNP